MISLIFKKFPLQFKFTRSFYNETQFYFPFNFYDFQPPNRIAEEREEKYESFLYDNCFFFVAIEFPSKFLFEILENASI